MAFLFMVDNTNRPINVKVWPQIRIKRGSYELLHALADTAERPMVDIVQDALKMWSMRNAENGHGVTELVELEAFLRELRVLLAERHETWEGIATYLASRTALVAQSHAFIRGMLHGI